MKSRHLALFALLVAFLSAPLAHAQDDALTDVVLVIDNSASMGWGIPIGLKQTITFETFQAKLRDFVNKGLPKNANVVLITFATNAKVAGSYSLAKAEEKRELLAAIDRMTPAGATYLTKAFDLALTELETLKKQSPKRHRLLFLMTDGKQEQEPEDKSPQLTFDQLRARLKSQLALKPTDDYTVWYAYFGDGDKEVRDFTEESLKGKAMQFKGAWRLGTVQMNRPVIELATVRPDAQRAWTQEFPSAANRELGDKIIVTGHNCANEKLEFEPAIPLPKDAQLSIAPLVLKDGEQQIYLEISGHRLPPGQYEGKVFLRTSGGYVVPAPLFFHLKFVIPDYPAIAVTPAAALDLGVASLQKMAAGRVTLQPNEAARELKANVEVFLDFPNLPDGVRLSGIPRALDLSKPQEMTIAAAIQPGHRAKPGLLTGKLRFTADQPAVALVPEALPVTVRLEAIPLVLGNVTHVMPGPLKVGLYSFPIELTALHDASVKDALPFKLKDPRPEAGAPPLTLDNAVFDANQARIVVKAQLQIPEKSSKLATKWTYEFTAESLDDLVAIKSARIRLEVFPPNVTAAQPVFVDQTIPVLKGEEGRIRVHFVAKSVPAEGMKVIVGAAHAAHGDSKGPEMDIGQGTFAITPLSPVIELKVGGAKGWKAGNWTFFLPLKSDDERHVVTPDLIPFQVKLEPTTLQVVQPAGGYRLPPQGERIIVQISTEGLPHGSRIPAKLEAAVVRQGVSIIAVQDKPLLLSNDVNKYAFDLEVKGNVPNAQTTVKMPLGSPDPRYVFEPPFIDVVLDNVLKDLRYPRVLTARMRAWPFTYPIRLPPETSKCPADEFRVRYRLPGQDWTDGKLSMDEPGTLVMMPLDYLDALAPIAMPDAGVTQVHFDLNHQGAKLPAQPLTIHIEEPCLGSPRLICSHVDGKYMVVARPEFLRDHEAAGLTLEGRWLVVIRDDVKEFAPGPIPTARLREWKVKKAANQASAHLNFIYLRDKSDGEKVKVHEMEAPIGSFWRGAEERRRDIYVAMYVKYKGGHEEWSDLVREQILIPGTTSEFLQLCRWGGIALGIVIGLYLFFLNVMWIMRKDVPHLDVWKFKISDKNGCATFLPSAETKFVGAFDESDQSWGEWLWGFHCPWRVGRLTITPSDKLSKDSTERTAAEQLVWACSGWRGLWMRMAESSCIDSGQCPARTWKKIDTYAVTAGSTTVRATGSLTLTWEFPKRATNSQVQSTAQMAWSHHGPPPSIPHSLGKIWAQVVDLVRTFFVDWLWALLGLSISGLWYFLSRIITRMKGDGGGPPAAP